MANITSLPKISVIIPSYNQGQFLEYCLKSILIQNYSNLEIIVIDGGSTDNSIEIINKFSSNITYWVSENDRGQSDAVNKGILKATGEIIGWINSDDIYLNHCMFKAVKLFKENPDWDIIFSNYYFIDEKSRIIKRRKEIPFDFSIYVWTNDCYHANCAGFFRKDVFTKAGLINESLNYGMDYEFYMRSFMNGCNIQHCNDYWGAYRLHNNSKSVSLRQPMKHEGLNIAKMFYPKTLPNSGILLKQIQYKMIRIIKKNLMLCYTPYIKSKKPLHLDFITQKIL